jgi:hypothetical protein
VIRRCTLDRTLDAVQRTGIHRELEATLNPCGTGRPRQLKVDVFLAGVLLTVGDKRPLTLVNVYATLTKNVALSARIALGTEYRPSPGADPRSLSIRQVRYLLEAIEKRLAHTEGRCSDLAPEDRDARAQALKHVLDKIIEASLPERLGRPTSLALDGTGLESWAKGKKRSAGAVSAASDPATLETSNRPDENDLDAIGGEGYSFDPDARWGYRSRTYDNKSTRCFGYELYNLVGVPEVGEDPSALPKLTYALTLRPLATDVVEPGLALFDGLTARGHAVTASLNDRAWSYMSAERWADELRRRGIDQVFDLHPADRGIRDFEGIAMIDGAPHCRAVLEQQVARHDMTVDDLAVINRPTKLAPGPTRKRASAEELANQEKGKRELEEFNAKIAIRRLAAFRRVQNARPTAKDQGKERWECPAEAGKVVCANCPASALLPEGTPEVEHPPSEATAPKCCTQRTVTIPGTVTPKLRQTLYWGSPEWIESFSRRTYVEGFFGNMKNPSAENVRRGWCRVVGIVKTSILAACAVAATNIRLLRSWAEGRDFTDPLCGPDDPDHGFEELSAAESAAVGDRLLPPRAGPPQPAAA